MSFIPAGHTIPKAAGDFLKFEEGENKIRILADSIAGFKWQDVQEDWHYSRQAPKIKMSDVKVDKFGKTIKFFVIMPVWSYNDNEVKTMELTQATIMRSIESLDIDKDWGDVKTYDLKINKGKGANGQVEYTIKPLTKAPIPKEFTDALADKEYDFEKRFEQSDVVASAVAEENVEIDDAF